MQGEKALLTVEGPYVQHNRNLLVRTARENECSHLFFMDHDMIFEPDAINRLLAHDVDVVGGAYNIRGILPRELNVWVNEERLATLPRELFKADAIGCGCMLIRMSVFDALPFPWFKIEETEDDLQVTEDIYFCNAVRKAGMTVWCDPTIRIGHLGEYTY